MNSAAQSPTSTAMMVPACCSGRYDRANSHANFPSSSKLWPPAGFGLEIFFAFAFALAMQQVTPLALYSPLCTPYTKNAKVGSEPHRAHEPPICVALLHTPLNLLRVHCSFSFRASSRSSSTSECDRPRNPCRSLSETLGASGRHCFPRLVLPPMGDRLSRKHYPRHWALQGGTAFCSPFFRLWVTDYHATTPVAPLTPLLVHRPLQRLGIHVWRGLQGARGPRRAREAGGACRAPARNNARGSTSCRVIGWRRHDVRARSHDRRGRWGAGPVLPPSAAVLARELIMLQPTAAPFFLAGLRIRHRQRDCAPRGGGGGQLFWRLGGGRCARRGRGGGRRGRSGCHHGGPQQERLRTLPARLCAVREGEQE